MQDDFFDEIYNGATLGPTDKNYKVYVEGSRPYAKFYFDHLDDVGACKFVGLWRDGALKIGYPGFFYRLPYVIHAAPSIYSSWED